MAEQRSEVYCWTEHLNAAFQLQYKAGSEGNGTGAVTMIHQLTGWPWHVCRTQACLLGLLKPHVHHEWTAELDQILEVGYQMSGRAKQEAIQRIHAQTGWPRHVCWNRARKLGLAQTHPRKWTADEDKYLLDFVCSKNLREIAKRLKRTVAAVRKRLLKLGGERKLSARVTDGHTKTELAQYLGCSRKTIQRWIDDGFLKGRYEGRNRVDDTLRITDEDFRAFWKKHPWEVPIFRLTHEGLLWFCSVMFDVPPGDYFGDPLDRRNRRLERKQQQLAEQSDELELEEA